MNGCLPDFIFNSNRLFHEWKGLYRRQYAIFQRCVPLAYMSLMLFMVYGLII